MENSDVVMDGTLSAYLDRSVRERPGAVGLMDRRRRITYAELDGIVNSAASALTARGPIAGLRVGIWLTKSAEAVAAIHAVLRAGAAYVPIDPTAPPRRVAAMLADCDASWLVTTAERAHALAGCSPGILESVSLLCVGEDPAGPPPAATVMSWQDAMARYAGAERVSVPAEPTDTAYLLYTSGSTGTPKGVVLTHGNARAFVDWAVEELALTSGDVLSSHAPLHFDLSILDLFGAAACGGGVALVPESRQGLGGALVRFVAENDISIWYSVPTALRRMAGSAEPLSGSRLRVVAFAGEEYPVRHLRSLREALPEGTALYNLYGPTETNVCTFHRVGEADLAGGGPAAPPIGRPCPYATTLLRAEDGTVPPGDGEATGELCVGGASTMRGYWNDPGRTADRFFDKDGKRYYRTGDIVRRLADGRLVFVGRDDGMVKVRGHRVELGEVEAALDGDGGVASAVCVVTRDPSGANRLVAFVTAAPGIELDARSLRRRCREYLPGYMVPERVEVVAELAYTSTGKIDRGALARRAERQPGPERERPMAVARTR